MLLLKTAASRQQVVISQSCHPAMAPSSTHTYDRKCVCVCRTLLLLLLLPLLCTKRAAVAADRAQHSRPTGVVDEQQECVSQQPPSLRPSLLPCLMLLLCVDIDVCLYPSPLQVRDPCLQAGVSPAGPGAGSAA